MSWIPVKCKYVENLLNMNLQVAQMLDLPLRQPPTPSNPPTLPSLQWQVPLPLINTLTLSSPIDTLVFADNVIMNMWHEHGIRV